MQLLPTHGAVSVIYLAKDWVQNKPNEPEICECRGNPATPNLLYSLQM